MKVLTVVNQKLFDDESPAVYSDTVENNHESEENGIDNDEDVWFIVGM